MVDLAQALRRKEDIVFLDIETTGLSRVYDYVTVIGIERNGVYHAHKEGDSMEKVHKMLRGANTLVTFNGTLFDVKFLQHHFKDLVFPPHHIDLRFLMRRIGYTGGQKAIEVSLGLKREEEVRGLTGYEAVVLWHEYRRGSIESLEQLLAYNHADIQGMKHMLEVLLKHEKIQETFKVRPARFPKQRFVKPKITKQSEVPKPKVYAKDLWKKVKGKHGAIIGIDLTGSEVRPSGFAVLHKDNTLETMQVNTDDEIIQLCKKYKPLLVSLDSPLGIPKGRTTCFDDDPGRQTYGIMREAERELKRRGVNVYPCLIPSMQRLTFRGMQLAKRLRRAGIRVIESYPGAAQDIMQIPRKHAGLPYLKNGLKEFGMKEGKWYKENVSHDELDAITSAIVGLFYLGGMYEGLGNDKEEYLVIPKI
jgi:predicted nuclease with RNAse H fold